MKDHDKRGIDVIYPGEFGGHVWVDRVPTSYDRSTLLSSDATADCYGQHIELSIAGTLKSKQRSIHSNIAADKDATLVGWVGSTCFCSQ